MQNLVKIQEELKNVPLQAVMSYVDGRNPMVPPYLALTELNRRKQIQQSSQAQQQPQATVKDQVQQQAGIMALQNQRAQQGMENMQQTAGRVPQPGAVPMNAPVQAQPAQMPVVKAAGGGLMRMPMRSDMFKANSYAGGGIVAFSGGGDTMGGFSYEDNSDMVPTVPDSDLSDEEKLEYLRKNGRLGIPQVKDLQEGKVTINELYNKAYRPSSVSVTKPAAAPAAPAANPSSAPPAPAVNPNAPKPNNLGGYGPLMSMKPRSTSLQDIFKEQQEANKLAGVLSPEQRYSKSDEMLKKLNEQMMQQRGQQGIEALAAAMARGSKGRRTSDALAGFGEGYFETAGKQRELNNKQDEAFATLERAKEKEADAIRRGDSAAIIKTKGEREKAEFDLNKTKAEIQYRQESVENKGDVAQERLDLEKEKALMKEFGYQSLIMQQTTLENRLRKDPNDAKAKQELDRIKLEIDKKRKEAGLSGRSGAPAASSAPQGKLVQNKDGSYSYQR